MQRGTLADREFSQVDPGEIDHGGATYEKHDNKKNIEHIGHGNCNCRILVWLGECRTKAESRNQATRLQFIEGRNRLHGSRRLQLGSRISRSQDQKAETQGLLPIEAQGASTKVMKNEGR
jgi:hypothetical protein